MYRFTPLLLAFLFAATGCATAQTPMDSPDRDLTAALTADTQASLTPLDVIGLLKDGNQRFLANQPLERDFLGQIRATSGGQYPMATILGCIDSRVPHEIVFDKGVGDIFSARIAGNFVNTDMLGSLEFATAVAGSRVIVVLGHTECGAVKGACDHVELGNLTAMLENIEPAVQAVGDLIPGEQSSANKEYVQAVADMNVRMTVANIVDRSRVIRDLVASGDVIVIGAMHDVSTGVVTFDEAGMMSAETLGE